jgi:RHS repeat-associated protein
MSSDNCPSAGSPQWVGDPVDTLTGAVLDQKLEFRLIGPLELWWQRHYDSSQSHRRFALGWGHTHGFDRTLRIEADGIVYEAPLGQTFSFPLLAQDGQQSSRHGFMLRRLSERNYELRPHAEPAMEFEFRQLHQPALLKRVFREPHQIQFRFGPAGRLEQIIDSAGRTIRVDTQADGRLNSLTLAETPDHPEQLLVAYTYDEQGCLVGTRNESGHGYSFTYDPARRMTCRTGRKGFRFRYIYDDQGRCTVSMGDDRLYGVALKYEVPGRLTKVTRPDRGLWSYVFDAAGRLSRIADPLGGTQQFVRDATGRMALELDQNLNATRVLHNAAGAVVAKVSPLGHRMAVPHDPNADDPLAQRVAAFPVEYEYGRLINKDRITLPTREQLARLGLADRVGSLVLVASGDALAVAQRPSPQVRPLGVLWWPGPKRGRVFNALGKLVQQHDASGRMRRWSYDASGNVSEHVDFDGSTWRYDTGTWHLLRSITNPLGEQVRHSYTTAGLVSSCTDAGGTQTEYRYDLNDHLVEVRRHGVVRDRYQRDAVGNLVAKQAADGRELLRNEIGPGNLVTRRSLASGDEHSFQYDPSGRCLVAATAKDTVQLSYDDLGNRACDKRNGLGVEHRYQGWRRPAESVVLGRFVVRYEWPDHQTLAITDPGGKTHHVRLKPHGLVERSFSNGVRETAQYDAQGRCLFKHAERGTRRPWTRRYHWSGEGELRHVEDSVLGDVRHAYDAAHRLRRRTVGDRVEDYHVDAADNLVGQPGLHDVELQDGNRLRSANGHAFTYNDRDHIEIRQSADGEIRYTYDSRDQLVRADLPDGVWTADYDALGRRTRKTWAGRTTEYYWNHDQLLGELAPDGRLRLYVYADPLALAPLLFLDYDAVDAPLPSGRRYFIFADQIGTPCLVEDEAGTAAWRAQVSPFGGAQPRSEAGLQLDLRFPGHLLDPELSLHYNRFRYFDPTLGRYIQSDPWGLGGGYNVYAYRTNPLATADVRGLGEEGHDAAAKAKDDEEIPPGMTRKEYDDLKVEMKALADAAWKKMQEARDNDQRTVTLDDGTVLKVTDSGMGPCLSVVKDLETGQVFYGQNTGKAARNLSQPLQERTDTVIAANQEKNPAPAGYEPGWDRHNGYPGSHSEVQALDQGLKARPGSQPEDFAVHNLRTKSNSLGNAGDPMPRCDNCEPITDGILALTD